jgi:ectoine hydroxylase-related dioxygenase (phytanoyl-CoA dioxygenase family)
MEEHLFAANGFALIPDVLTVEECEALAAWVPSATENSAGTRCLLPKSWCASLAKHLRKNAAISKLLPEEFVATQCTYFEKSASRNWLVPVHQDLSIPVAERVPHPALRGWSEKEGSLYVQAPTEILQQLVAVRVHLDVCALQDGPLRVIPGTHRRGYIQPKVAATLRETAKDVACCAQRGEALVLRPLLLHSSSKSTGKSKRRVLHFLFGPRQLPHGLRWQHVV